MANTKKSKTVNNSCDGGFFTQQRPWIGSSLATGITLGGIGGLIIGGPVGGLIGAGLGLMGSLATGFLSSLALLTLECCCQLPDTILAALHCIIPSICAGVMMGSVIGLSLCGPAAPAGALAGALLGFIGGAVIGLISYSLVPLIAEALGIHCARFCGNSEVLDSTEESEEEVLSL